MSGVLFSQSGVADPYALYASRLRDGAVQYDSAAGVWAVYSYAGCKAVLASPDAHVPRAALEGLRDEAALIGGQLVRLANPPSHATLRAVAQRLFDRLRGGGIARLTDRLLREQAREFDWVTVCKRLPPLALMDGLGFAASSIAMLSPHIDVLAKLMQPAKPAALLADLQESAKACWPVLQTEAARLTGKSDEAAAANLAGLLIQSCDATRGLLSNALLSALALPAPPASAAAWRALAQETLRHDPPIHNTRRTLAAAMEIGGVPLQAGEPLLLVLAAANRDPSVFAQPEVFDWRRENAAMHLTFGFGAHGCLAREYAVLLAAEALARLFAAGPVRLAQRDIRHAPLVNARLPEALRIRTG